MKKSFIFARYLPAIIFATTFVIGTGAFSFMFGMLQAIGVHPFIQYLGSFIVALLVSVGLASMYYEPEKFKYIVLISVSVWIVETYGYSAAFYSYVFGNQVASVQMSADVDSTFASSAKERSKLLDKLADGVIHGLDNATSQKAQKTTISVSKSLDELGKMIREQNRHDRQMANDKVYHKERIADREKAGYSWIEIDVNYGRSVTVGLIVLLFGAFAVTLVALYNVLITVYHSTPGVADVATRETAIGQTAQNVAGNRREFSDLDHANGVADSEDTNVVSIDDEFAHIDATNNATDSDGNSEQNSEQDATENSVASATDPQPRQRRQRTRIDPDKRKALRLMQQGLNDNQIAEQVGKHRATIGRWRESFNGQVEEK